VTRRASCGTPAAYLRHIKRHEPTCDACKAAWAAHRRAERAPHRTGLDPVKVSAENRTAARQRRIAAYRYMTRTLGWQPWRAAKALNIGSQTRWRYEREIAAQEQGAAA
jgi:hypothetical protein